MGLLEQKTVSLMDEYLNKYHQKSIYRHLLIIAVDGDELELILIETGEPKEQYKILDEVKTTIGTGKLLDEMILNEVMDYISKSYTHQSETIKKIVEVYELGGNIELIKEREIKKYIEKLKHQVSAIKYILNYFQEMSLKIVKHIEPVVIDQMYFEEEFLEQLDLKELIKFSMSEVVQKMNNAYKKWAIDEVLLVGRMVQIPYIKHVLQSELKARGIDKSRIVELADQGPIYTMIKDLFYLSHRIEEQEDNNGLRKIEYQTRVYEYVKKEVNRRTNKEEITLRFGKAEEKYPADKERYFKFLPLEMKQKEILDFQIAVLDESNQYSELMDFEYIKKLVDLEKVEGGEKFIRYFISIEELVDELKQNEQIQYILIVANESQYNNYIMQLNENVTEIKKLHICLLQNERVILAQEAQNVCKEQLELVDKVIGEPKMLERRVMAEYEVTFNGGYYAYFTDYYQVDLVDRRKSIVEEKYVRQLKSRDQVIFVDDKSTHSKNIMMYILEATINSKHASWRLKEDYQLFLQWKEELQTYLEHHGCDTQHIAILLEQYGVSITKQAVDQWLPDGRTIAPQTQKSLISLIDIVGTSSLVSKKGQAYEASKRIRRLHVQIKQLVEEMIFRELSMKHSYYTGINYIAYEKVKEFKNYSKILEVQSVKRIRKKIKVSQVNRVLKE